MYTDGVAMNNRPMNNCNSQIKMASHTFTKNFPISTDSYRILVLGAFSLTSTVMISLTGLILLLLSYNVVIELLQVSTESLETFLKHVMLNMQG